MHYSKEEKNRSMLFLIKMIVTGYLNCTMMVGQIFTLFVEKTASLKNSESKSNFCLSSGTTNLHRFHPQNMIYIQNRFIDVLFERVLKKNRNNCNAKEEWMTMKKTTNTKFNERNGSNNKH